MTADQDAYWCEDCACNEADHNQDGTCAACGDCYHPHFVRIVPPATTEGAVS